MAARIMTREPYLQATSSLLVIAPVLSPCRRPSPVTDYVNYLGENTLGMEKENGHLPHVQIVGPKRKGARCNINISYGPPKTLIFLHVKQKKLRFSLQRYFISGCSKKPNSLICAQWLSPIS